MAHNHGYYGTKSWLVWYQFSGSLFLMVFNLLWILIRRPAQTIFSSLDSCSSCLKSSCSSFVRSSCNTRGVVLGGAMAAPDFGRSSSPISTKGGRFCPPYNTGTYGFSDLPTALNTTRYLQKYCNLLTIIVNLDPLVLDFQIVLPSNLFKGLTY